MAKRTDAQKRASKKYETGLKSLGYTKLSFWILPEWKEAINELINELENYKG